MGRPGRSVDQRGPVVGVVGVEAHANLFGGGLFRSQLRQVVQGKPAAVQCL